MAIVGDNRLVKEVEIFGFQLRGRNKTSVKLTLFNITPGNLY
jgi:hypothetical protein